MKLTEEELAIMNEAFMVGRIYSSSGEKETPAAIYSKLLQQCQLIKRKIILNALLKDADQKAWKKC